MGYHHGDKFCRERMVWIKCAIGNSAGRRARIGLVRRRENLDCILNILFLLLSCYLNDDESILHSWLLQIVYLRLDPSLTSLL